MSMRAKSRTDWVWIGITAAAFGLAWLCDRVHSDRLAALGGAVIVALALALVLFRRARDRSRGDRAPKVKMYCIMAKESLDKMKGVRGKMIAQGGHAWLHAFWDAQERFPHLAALYRDSRRAYKITLVVPEDADLHRLQSAYVDVCGVSLVEALLVPTVADLERLRRSYTDVCGVSLVEDAGFTVFEGPTVTCLGIGPITEDLVGDDLKNLRTLT